MGLFNINIDKTIVDAAVNLADLKWKKELDHEWIQVFNDKPLYYLDANMQPVKFKNIESDEKIIRVFTSPSTYIDTNINPRITICLGCGIIFFDNTDDAKRFSSLYQSEFHVKYFEQNERTFALKSEHVTSWTVTDKIAADLKKLNIDGLYSIEFMDGCINLKSYYDNMVWMNIYNKYECGKIIKIKENVDDERNTCVSSFIQFHNDVNETRINRYSPYNSRLLFEISLVGNTVYVCDYDLRIPPHGISTDCLLNTVLHGWRVFRSKEDALDHYNRINRTGNVLIHLEDRKYKTSFYNNYCSKKNKTYKIAVIIVTRVALFVFNTKYKNKMMAIIEKERNKIIDKIKNKNPKKPSPEDDGSITANDIVDVIDSTKEGVI